MGPFDVTLFSLTHLLLFAGCFLGVWLGAAWVIHYRPQPLQVKGQPQIMYGGSVLIAVIILASAYVLQSDVRLWASFCLAAILITIIGYWDERKTLASGYQFLGQIAAAAIVVTGGWVIPYISNPWGASVLSLQWFSWGFWLFPSAVISILWLLALMNAVNWLDGVDGLVSSVIAVVFAALIAISLLPATQDALTLALAVIGLGATSGFLIWNASPAKIYLGTTGSWLLGLYVGLVALVGGGKIVTTMLVLAWPIVDAAAVIIQRLILKQKPWEGDKRHWHWRLLARGLSPGTIVVLAVVVSLFLAVAGIVLPTSGKIAVLAACSVAGLIISLRQPV